MLCSADLLSGNCGDFVSEADRLGALYRAELKKLPDSEEELKATIWWGCGPGFPEIKALLVRIDSEAARTVLQTEPYRSVPEAAPPPSPSRPGAPAPVPACEERSSALARNRCIGEQLEAARTAHRRAFDRCKQRVDPALRDDLLRAESSFEALLPGRCDAQAVEGDDASMRAFLRSRCLAEALDARTQGMLEAHPECAATD